MALTPFGQNKQANSIVYDKVRVHTGAPGDDGTANQVRDLTPTEIADGKTPYADQAISFAAAVNGSRDSNNVPELPIPSGETITHYSLWEGVNCVDVGPVPTPEPFGGFGIFRFTDVDTTTT
jgi:hypothetical protein